MTAKKIRHLPVTLSDTERKQRAERLAECIQKKAAISADRKTATSLAYRATQEVDAEIQVLSEVVSKGQETREVEVEERKDLGRRVLEVFRTDTKELVDSRQLSIEETQDDLPFQREQGEHAVSHRVIDDDENDPTPRGKRRRPGANA